MQVDTHTERDRDSGRERKREIVLGPRRCFKRLFSYLVVVINDIRIIQQSCLIFNEPSTLTLPLVVLHRSVFCVIFLHNIPPL